MTTSIPQTARAAVLREYKGDYVLTTDHPVKQPSELAPEECLIKLEYSGVCHSDLHIKNNEWSRAAKLPLVGGHEGIGHVVAIGAHATSDDVKVGDRVGIKWIGEVCLRCEMCRQGHESSCPRSFQTSHGFMLDGTFSEYVVSFTKYVTPIPDGISSAAAAPILCAGMTVYKALKQSNATIGNWVAIPGAGGGLGHLAVQYAVAMGLRVVAIDTGEVKKNLCMELGAEKWIDFRESCDVVEDVRTAAGGAGPHAAIIAVGEATPFNQAIQYLRATGTLVAVGIPERGILNVPVALLINKSLAIVGSAIGNRQDVAEALEIAAQGKVNCQLEIKGLEDLNSVFEDMSTGQVAGRIVLKL